MRVMANLALDTLTGVGAAAQAAEDAGFDAVMSMENQHEPFMPLAVAALATREIELTTGIAIAFARSPMVVANTCWDLQEASGGRFVLGLGSQVKGHNERRFSVAWSPPAPRLREYVEALRAIWRAWALGEKLAYEGEHYRFSLMTPNFTPKGTGQPMAPVTIAAVGPAMLRVAGRVCDGVRLHPFCTRRYLEDACLPLIQEGLDRRGKPRSSFEIAGGGFVVTGATDEEVARRVEWVRYRIAFYGSTRLYWPVLEAHGLHDLGEKLLRLSLEQAWDRMAAEIPDDVVRLFAAVGTHAEIAGAIAARFGGAVDSLYTGLMGRAEALPPDLIQDIRRIPAAFAGYDTERGRSTC